MNSGKNIAVIDIGKTNAKVVLVDANTMDEITVEKTRNQVLNSKPYPHFNVDEIWEFILGSLGKLHAAYGISTISITTHGACAALLNKSGNLAAPILDYEYQGVDQTAAEYERTRPKFAETGSPRLAGGLNLGAQIFWLFETVEGLKDSTDAILMYPQYWAQRLTGIIANEVTSLGCHTDLWNPYTNDFSSMVDKLDWRDRFAPLRPANQILGTLSTSVADQIGLPADTPVLCGIHDSNASL
ncbi:MAG: FGGY family carbohydrate kinase, partial [Pseudomonadota bacterium]